MSSQDTSRRYQSGFTLIELLVTLAVAAILLGVAAPALQSFVIGNRLTAAANELTTAIQLARAEAIRLNRSVSLCTAATATATVCDNTLAGTNWQHWIVVSTGLTEPVLRRGLFEPQSGLIVRASPTVVTNTITFRSDSLARSGATTNLLNGAIRVCAAVTRPEQNARLVQVVNGSRVGQTSAALGAAGCTTAVPNS